MPIEAPTIVANSTEQGLLAAKRYGLPGAYIVCTDQRPRFDLLPGDVIFTEGWHLGRHAQECEKSIRRSTLRRALPQRQ